MKKPRLAPWAGALGFLALMLGGPEQNAAQDQAPGQPPASQGPQTAFGPEVMLELPWGSGGTMLGRIDGSEAASYGPLSFSLSPAGELFILDQVNLRILSFYADGSFRDETALPAAGCEDIGISADGSIVLLSRTKHKTLFVVDESSGAVRRVGIEGAGIVEGGLVTAMFVEGDGVWLEVLNETIVRVLDAALFPCERTVMPGRRFDGHGVTLVARWMPPRGARLWLQDADTGAVTAGRDLAFPYDIERIIWWDRDAASNVYAVFHLMQFDDRQPYTLAHEEVVGMRLNANLDTTGTFTSPHAAREWMQFKEFMVEPGGVVVQMAFTDVGVRFLRWRWP